MENIELTKGKVAIVDDEDYKFLSQYKWGAFKNRNIYYAARMDYRGKKRKNILMHRVIMGEPTDMQIDHINGNGLDNRRINLRVVTQSQNLRNSWKHRIGKVESDIKSIGVTVKKYKDKIYYQAQGVINGKNVYLGCYPTEELAHEAYKNSLTNPPKLKRVG